MRIYFLLDLPGSRNPRTVVIEDPFIVDGRKISDCRSKNLRESVSAMDLAG